VADFPCEGPSLRLRLFAQLLEQRVRVLEVGGVEPFVHQIKASASIPHVVY
jgi:hypothetical protein